MPKKTETIQSMNAILMFLRVPHARGWLFRNAVRNLKLKRRPSRIAKVPTAACGRAVIGRVSMFRTSDGDMMRVETTKGTIV